ncbi:hypothetical protein K2Z83_16180 [Oscillochloris sp. ZM17-4]|uniref:GAF domain-containing sensor histidine kinase n=1 Tax=Oscillochloris sp. ZM17-4 TaxID=2866714 RepID=UPI001C738F5E|nr:ATP-binding protein [Oscillochloris sp. ZM17-4]MBX0329212.1 hypothetical protein [Oscillochloris sp. ZM17-4]
MTSAVETFSLPALLGMTKGQGCLMSPEQIRALATLLLRSRPEDMRAGCFLGGALTVGGGRTQDDVVVLSSTFGVAPFLVIAGQQGAIAILTWPEGAQYRTRVITDPEYVDRAALVLAQLSDHEYTMSDLVDAEVQRAYVARLAATLVAELRLSDADYRALMPEEQRWLTMAAAMAKHTGVETLLALPEVRQIFHELGAERALLGQLDADQRQLTPLASDGGGVPAAFVVQQGVIASVIRRRRPGSAASAAASGLDGIGGWAGNNALTAVPLLRDERVWGLLIIASPRAITGPAQAMLHGLGTLLELSLEAAPQASASAGRPTPGSPGMLIEGSASPTRAPLTRAPAGAGRPAPRSEASHIIRDLGALLSQLGDAVLLVDGRGQIANYTPALARMLGMGASAHGQALVASGGACLAPLLTEALMEEHVDAREIELPGGKTATARVIAFSQGLWAFVLSSPESGLPAPAAAPVAAPPAETSPIPESERNESFLANFSNIIRVPLRELRELITRVPVAGELNEQQSRLIGQVVRLNSELTMLVNDLLALGQIRLQAGDHRAPLRIDLLIEAAVGTQYAEFGRRGQHVVTELQPGLPRVFGSEEGLGRAVAALIDNAIKYSPAGAHIRVVARHEGGDLVVSIADNGLGLRPDELAQIFDPFYRAETTGHLGISGRGLGLTIAKAVIEQHDGKIWAEGTPGKGCTFSFRLPVAETA